MPVNPEAGRQRQPEGATSNYSTVLRGSCYGAMSLQARPLVLVAHRKRICDIVHGLAHPGNPSNAQDDHQQILREG